MSGVKQVCPTCPSRPLSALPALPALYLHCLHFPRSSEQARVCRKAGALCFAVRRWLQWSASLAGSVVTLRFLIEHQNVAMDWACHQWDRFGEVLQDLAGDEDLTNEFRELQHAVALREPGWNSSNCLHAFRQTQRVGLHSCEFPNDQEIRRHAQVVLRKWRAWKSGLPSSVLHYRGNRFA